MATIDYLEDLRADLSRAHLIVSQIQHQALNAQVASAEGALDMIDALAGILAPRLVVLIGDIEAIEAERVEGAAPAD